MLQHLLISLLSAFGIIIAVGLKGKIAMKIYEETA
jgi:hypothetical protein